MPDELERLVETLAREGAEQLLPFVPDRANPQAELGLLLQEPQTIGTAIIGHELYQEAVDAAAADADLSLIAPLGGRGPVLAAISGWHRLSVRSLVVDLVAAAVAELRCLALEPTADQLVGIAMRNLEQVRRIARGEPTEVTTYLGFNGVKLPDDRTLRLPWGQLTAPKGWYGVAEVYQPRPTSCVLQARHPLVTSVIPTAPDDRLGPMFVDPDQVPKAVTGHHDWTLRTLQLVSLSIVLATAESRVAPLTTFEVTVLPYEHPMGASGQLVLAPPAPDRALTEDECARIEDWARILEQRFTRRLDIAGRRIIAALSHRLEATDRLIDAVTAWESLFSGQVEASLRVTGAIAALLEPTDGPKRDDLQRHLTKVYNLRSDVVHGRSADPQLVYTRSYEATDGAIRALAALLDRRPELIALDPGERSRRLLLGLS